MDILLLTILEKKIKTGVAVARSRISYKYLTILIWQVFSNMPPPPLWERPKNKAGAMGQPFYSAHLALFSPFI